MQQQEVKLYDIYGVYYEPWFLQKWFVWSVIALIVGVIGYVLYRWYSKRKLLQKSYWQQAYETLELLDLSDWSVHKEFYSLLTLSVKQYIHCRFNVSFGLTDNEFLEALKNSQAAPDWVYDDVKDMFEGVMFVKFANATTGERRMQHDIDLFSNLLEKTKPSSR